MKYDLVFDAGRGMCEMRCNVLRTEPWVVSQYHCLLKMDTLVISMGVEGLAHTVIAEIAFVIDGCSIIIIAQFFTPTGFVLVGLKK